MKKTFALIFAVLIFCITVIPCLAGSVPEDLLGSDDAQVFFAKVTEYHPDKDRPTIELTPVKNVKGDVSIGTEQSYLEAVPVGNFTPNVNDVYLFAYYNSNNPTYIFRVSDYDTKTLKIKGISGMDMWERFEEYLNKGKYEEAERKRQNSMSTSGIPETQGTIEELPPMKNYHTEIGIGCTVLAAVLIAVICFKKKVR